MVINLDEGPWDNADDGSRLALEMEGPGRISSDGSYLAASPCQGREILLRPVENPGPNMLFLPGSLAWDGAHLWVGEFKFSTRILRFSL